MHQLLLHEIVSDIISGMTFPVRYKTAVDSGSGVFTLSGIKKIHHLQPGFTVTIGSDSFIVKDYIHNDCDYTVELYAGSNSLPTPTGGTVVIGAPVFKHGTPMQCNNELQKLILPQKVPLIYLLEPYETTQDFNVRSSIWGQITAVICFLSEGDTYEWATDQFYHNTVNPMVNLMGDFMKKVLEDKRFYTAELKTKPKYHTKFGIYVKEEGVKQLKFNEKYTGVSVEILFEPYKIDECLCCIDFATSGGETSGASFDGSFDNSFDNGDVT